MAKERAGTCKLCLPGQIQLEQCFCKKKFYWDRVMLICLRIASDCIPATVAELGKRPNGLQSPNFLQIQLFAKKKLADA